jgi:hypothetical protein
MAIPGFTAGAALYPTSNHYRIVGPVVAETAQGVTAQQGGGMAEAHWCDWVRDDCRLKATLYYNQCLMDHGCTPHYPYEQECRYAMWICGDVAYPILERECVKEHGC